MEKVGEERVEGWMRESIAEIVRHIGEAPFLVHLFNDDDGGSGRGGAGRVTVRRETASAESWPDVRRRWGPADAASRRNHTGRADRRGGRGGRASAGAGAAEAARRCGAWWCRPAGWSARRATCSTPAASAPRRGSAPTSASPGRSASATPSSSSSATPGSTASPAAGSHRRRRRRGVLMY